MERVKGLYKRYTQFWLYVWAALLTVALNLDSLELAKRLLADAQFRGALTVAATNAVTRAELNGTNAPLQLSQLQQEINKLKLPVGWEECPPRSDFSLARVMLTAFPKLYISGANVSPQPSFFTGWILSPPSCPANPREWWLKLLGLLITVAAISQGAPFWFDLLNRVTNLRAVGRPPETKKPSS